MTDTMTYANDNPWIFICFIMCITTWRILKYLAKALFDEKTGLLPKYTRTLSKDSRETKLSIAESRSHATQMFADNMEHSNAIEVRIIKKIDDNGKEVKHLLGQIINKDK